MSIGFEGMNDGFSYHEDTVICAVLIVLGVAVCIFLTCYFSKRYKLCRRETPQVDYGRSRWQNMSLADLSRQYQDRFEDLGPVGVTPPFPPPPVAQEVPRPKARLEARLSALETAARMSTLESALDGK